MGFHIVKRDNFPMWKRCLLYLAAIVAALLAGAGILLSIGVNPIDYYYKMFTMGTVGNRIAYKTYMNYLNEFVPLVITAMGLSVAFKMRFWNIGGEGQFIMGAVSATAVAFKLGPVAPTIVTLIVMCLAAFLAAGVYGLIAGILKVKFGTNETLLTLMLNYIALYFLTFIGETKASWNFFLQEQSNRPVFESFKNIVGFTQFPIGPKFKLSICVVLAFVIGILLYIYLKRTKQGYEISVIGDSANTAHYAGMKVNKIILRTVFLSAGIIGLGAAFKVGTTGVLSTAITDDVGWTGIVVAWLAQLSTPVIFVVSALFCVLQVGSVAAAATISRVDSSFANILQGAILFLVLTADFFIRFRIARKTKGGEKNG